tara:strand:+ start:662 stop:1666 length:1005 start_codon:yes stop_codon:yes gene_type:complete
LSLKNQQTKHFLTKDSTAEWGESHTWNWYGIYCHWRILGKENKKPLVLIHGFGASSSHWRQNAKYFASKNFRVFAIDLIGFGQSEQANLKRIKYLDNIVWAKQLNDFLEEIVETERNGKAVLIGNSLGALTAISSAALKPELIEMVIAAPLPDPAFMEFIQIKFPMRLGKDLRKIKLLLLKIFFNLLPIEIIVYLIAKSKIIILALQGAYYKSIWHDKELHSIVKEPALRASAAKALRSMCIGMASRPKELTAPSLLKKIDNLVIPIPVLVVWGKKDQLVPLMLGKKIIKQFRRFKLLVLENTGHCPHDESPTIFNKYVWEWIEFNSKLLKGKK